MQYLGMAERDLVCAYLQCRVGVIHMPNEIDTATGTRYTVHGIQLSPVVPGQDPQTTDYVMLRQPRSNHTDAFGQRGAWTWTDMKEFADAWQFQLYGSSGFDQKAYRWWRNLRAALFSFFFSFLKR